MNKFDINSTNPKEGKFYDYKITIKKIENKLKVSFKK